MSRFKMGDKVRKVSGSQWHGTVVGTYSTDLTPEGYTVESFTENGSVQIYPAKALELWEPASKPLGDESLKDLLLEHGYDRDDSVMLEMLRRVEAAHGIKGNT